ncbi:MAG: bifunctional (p)ppGpp synthetase/guanosine-3',5'-bis(diphosphate) 3'-pyrophosphohydrolase, partial [Enterococcus sp.]|nr:bifunctional (p)ppGpp synthetase/guanosine-3',5'-bis(diphosphate) 3'-pyrophosphohydrolase [Enterococcus sp.]
MALWLNDKYNLNVDERKIVLAGILHDTVEDTDYTIEDVEAEFGQDIAHIVGGVTKLGTIKFNTEEEEQAENFRKLFLAMSKDIRVLLVKLSDRLHNMRTIEFMPPDRIKVKCKETLDIYAPLASRLGVYSFKTEFEDISLRYLNPEAYNSLNEELEKGKEKRQKLIGDISLELELLLNKHNINHKISGRNKQLYSVYRKMQNQNLGLEEIFDITAFRIIVDDLKDCYMTLGIVHDKWYPIPGKFKDYIAMPKPNGYKSLHTTLLSNDGQPFEIQIRTKEMHEIAEYGVAAHWRYKEVGSGKINNDQLKLSWWKDSLELQNDVDDSSDFVNSMKMDVFSSQVYVFTPAGDLKELPKGATPIDFAFKIHTDVGIKCTGAKVNGKMVTIDHMLETGDIVDIITSKNAKGPSNDWLKIAKSSFAKNKIKNFLKKRDKLAREEAEKNAIRNKERLIEEQKQRQE